MPKGLEEMKETAREINEAVALGKETEAGINEVCLSSRMQACPQASTPPPRQLSCVPPRAPYYPRPPQRTENNRIRGFSSDTICNSSQKTAIGRHNPYILRLGTSPQAREVYRPVAAEASLMYFMLLKLSTVDTMYQYSLDSFTR